MITLKIPFLYGMHLLTCLHSPDLREDTAFFPEGVETLVTGLGSLGGYGQQVRGATTFDTAWKYKRRVKKGEERDVR